MHPALHAALFTTVTAAALATAGWVLAAVLAVALLGAMLWAWRHKYLLRIILRASEQLADGEIPEAGALHGPPWAGAIVAQLDRAARQFEHRLDHEMHRRLELEAVYGSMIEGVIVIDLDRRIRRLNQAAARLLHTDEDTAIGRDVLEVVRDLSLQEFIGEALITAVPIQEELSLRLSPTATRGKTGEPAMLEPRLLETQASPVKDVSGGRIGAVIVLHDVTHLRRLEAVRRDFVANVSHEIKTPVTAIKASVETIEDSPDVSPEDLEHFVSIVGRQADRLQAIIEDLLALARIEQEAADARIELKPLRLAPILQSAFETCQAKAESRAISVIVNCPSDLTARINATLLEQAVVNLLDNAIKYSPEASHVVARGVEEANEVRIEVADEGQGIAAEHLPRLFERFYRTDRARSRALGGTGLGLAIVKHIAEAHGGHVSVDSRPGRGSTFRLHLQPATATAKRPGRSGDDHPGDQQPSPQPTVEQHP